MHLPRNALTSQPLQSRLSAYAPPVCLFLITWGLYARSLHVPFVWDDYHVILNNSLITDPVSFFKALFFSKPRALVDLTFGINNALGGKNVIGYHLVNVFLHACNVVLVYCISLHIHARVVNREPASAIEAHGRFFAMASALIFLCHPLQTQAVTYIAQRYTSMSALFVLLSIYAFLKGRLAPLDDGRLKEGDKPKPLCTSFAWFTASVLLGYLAFLCKQSALSLPFLILLMESLLFQGSLRFWRPMLPWILPLSVVALLGILWNLGFFRNDFHVGLLLDEADRLSRETLDISRSRYFFTQLRVLCVYITLLVLPVSQSLDWHYPFVQHIFDGWTPVAAGFVAGLLWTMWRLRRRLPAVSLSIGWFFAAQIIESSIFPIRDALVEHRLYLPLVGYAWLVSYELTRWRTHRALPPMALLCLLTIVLATAAVLRTETWRDPVRIWQEAAKKNPSNFRAYTNLGFHYLQQARVQDALAPLQRALKLNPWRPKVHVVLADYYVKTHNWSMALAHMHTALVLDPSTSSHYYNVGFLYHNLGNVKTAQDFYRACLILDPNHEKATTLLATILWQTGQRLEAKALLQDFMERHPNNSTVCIRLAELLASRGEFEEALALVQRVLHRHPTHPRARALQSQIFQSRAVGNAVDTRHGPLPVP